MFRIGVFARLGQVSVRTLRFYDERGLLRPARVDTQTGYRYYHADQIPRLLQILALCDLGFSLEEIGTAVQKPLAPDTMKTLLEQKQRELRERLQKDQETLTRIEVRLLELHQQQTIRRNPTYEVALKAVPALLTAAIYATIPTWDEVTPTFDRIFDELFSLTGKQGIACVGPGFDLWFDEEMKEADMKVAACCPIASAFIESEPLHQLALPAVETMAFTVHRGPFGEALGRAHQALIEWIEKNSYRITGPTREIYHVYDRQGDSADWVTEIQYPVERAPS